MKAMNMCVMWLQSCQQLVGVMSKTLGSRLLSFKHKRNNANTIHRQQSLENGRTFIDVQE